MIFQIISTLCLLFICYAVYLSVIVPYQEKKREDLRKLDKYLEVLEKTK